MDQDTGYIDVERDDGTVFPLKIECIRLLESESIEKNIRENIVRDIPRFVVNSGKAELKSEPLAIVSCGHSLKDQLSELREFKHIMVCGSAHDYLVRHGIIPTYATVCDGGKEDKENLSLPQKDTLYLIASQCDPALFDQLKDFNVEMWHYRGQVSEDLAKETVFFQGEPSIAWGSTVTLTSVHLAVLLGHQHLHFFGFDNCYSEYGVAQHVCEVAGGREYEKRALYVGDRKRFFITNLALAAQLNQFFQLVEMWREWIHIYLHGRGLTHAMVEDGDPELLKFVSLV